MTYLSVALEQLLCSAPLVGVGCGSDGLKALGVRVCGAVKDGVGDVGVGEGVVEVVGHVPERGVEGIEVCGARGGRR